MVTNRSFVLPMRRRSTFSIEQQQFKVKLKNFSSVFFSIASMLNRERMNVWGKNKKFFDWPWRLKKSERNSSVFFFIVLVIDDDKNFYSSQITFKDKNMLFRWSICHQYEGILKHYRIESTVEEKRPESVLFRFSSDYLFIRLKKKKYVFFSFSKSKSKEKKEKKFRFFFCFFLTSISFENVYFSLEDFHHNLGSMVLFDFVHGRSKHTL